MEGMPKNLESLKNMNPHIGGFAVWYVRVVDGEIIQYEFKSRNETVYAEKFECLLVSKDP